MIWVLDSSAVLADFLKEPGYEIVRASSGKHMVSTVNIAEVYAKLFERGVSAEKVEELRAIEPFSVAEFDRSQAMLSAQLRRATMHKGLSLGDRACLALALQQKATVLTADKAWSELDLGLEIKVIR